MRPRQAKRDGVKRTEAFLAISPVEEVQVYSLRQQGVPDAQQGVLTY